MAPPGFVSCAPNDHYVQIIIYWTLSQLLAAALYGVVITLGSACVTLVRQTRGGLKTPENRILVGYIVGMMCFGTISIISCIVELTKTIKHQCFIPRGFFGKPGMIAFVLANWGADGFLLWRCWLIYEGLSSVLLRRALRLAVVFLGLASLGVGVTYLSLAFSAKSAASLVLFATACSSLFINFFISLLIAGRIWYTGSSLEELFGKEHLAIYRKIIAMLVESATLVVVFYLVYIIMAASASLPSAQRMPLRSLQALVPLLSLTQVYVIASLLIVYRGARSKIQAQPPSHDVSFQNSTGRSHDVSFAFVVDCEDVNSTRLPRVKADPMIPGVQ